ncbi:MAG: DUF5681 domain-containing protein [Alphaproteobacteria bacterium]
MSKDDEDAYEVGYGRPPKKARFKKGRSGNPKGRPKGSKNFKSIVKDELGRPVEIRVNGQRRKVSQFEAVVMRAVGDAISGKPRQIGLIMDLPNRFGLIEDEERLVRALAPEDQRILERIIMRRVEEALKVLS